MSESAVVLKMCPEKTRHDLEWDRVLGALAERCGTPMGREAALHLPFIESNAELRRALDEAREASELLRDGEPLLFGELVDVAEALSRLRVSGVLGAIELRAVASVLAQARGLRRFLGMRKVRLPALLDACTTDPMLDAAADEVSSAFEPDGTLSDKASPRLRELRAEASASRQRILSRLEDIMGRYESALQDRYIAEREGRYVLPVRSDSHERFPGLLHATSSSGATLFLEPRAVIQLGNRLKVLESEVQREEQAIYASLSLVLADVLPSIEAAVIAIARADVRAATARLAEELSLSFVNVVDEPHIDLIDARHPLLVLDMLGKGDVVASDLAIAAGRAMVVSGPNAGGKTVALKTIGLAALMVRAGLPIACAPQSTVGIFDTVLTDVGDEQNLHKNLSTFSAHVRNLVTVLEETHRGSLVLLDELAGGTDPREGEALAAGVLDSLCARGGAVVVTTHYEGLKALALGDERFENASVGFDIEALRPTFRVTRGVPGSSSALAVARQYGMPSTVVDRAHRFLSREDRNFEQLVRKLNDERSALDLARQAADAREREAEVLRVRLEAEVEQAKARERTVLTREGEALMQRLRRAKEDLRAAQVRMRTKSVDEGALRDAARALERVASSVALGGELESLVLRQGEASRDAVTPNQLKKGGRVYVPRLRAEAEIVEVLAGGEVRVAAGPLKLKVSVSDLRVGATKQPRSAVPRVGAVRSMTPQSLEVAIQTSDNTCDLRGMRVDDALSMATAFLDRALTDSRRVVFFVHGHGTGALKDAVREELRNSRYIEQFRAATPEEGGDGATVAWLV